MAKRREETLERFAARLEAALGDNLVSLVLYGSAARGDYDATRSDLNVLMILRDAAPAALRPVGEAIGAWVKAGEPPPLILSERGWRASTDVFPIEIEDMREAHHLLRGRDPFAGITTARRDLRHELEREIRGKLLQLRAEYAAAESDPKALSALLERATPTFLVLFRALLRFHGTQPPPEPGALVRQAASIAGFDAGAFDWPVARLGGRKAALLEAHDPKAVAYLEAVERVEQYVDELGDGGPTLPSG